jgi:hypothetical protein
MFIIALILGPAVGLLIGDLVFRTWRLRRFAAALLIAISLIIIIALPLSLEFKVGFVLGLVLGLALATTRTPGVDEQSA